MTEERSLYERLGGYDAIAGITDSFLGRVMGDATVGRYWGGHSEDTKRRERQLIVDFLSEAAGGPSFYTGRDMETSHQGLGINDGEWEIMMRHCIASLDEFAVAEADKNDVCSFMESLRAQIVAAG